MPILPFTAARGRSAECQVAASCSKTKDELSSRRRRHAPLLRGNHFPGAQVAVVLTNHVHRIRSDVRCDGALKVGRSRGARSQYASHDRGCVAAQTRRTGGLKMATRQFLSLSTGTYNFSDASNWLFGVA